jgi:hypothetical protein
MNKQNCTCQRSCGPGGGGAVYGLGFVGALVYYLQHAATFWEGLLGILKACVWPALLMYRVLSEFHI